MNPPSLAHRASIGVVAIAVVVASLACSGRVAGRSAAGEEPGPDAGFAADATANGGPDAEDAYGARFQGDADQCAAIVCTGAQVCCVVSIASDAPTVNPNNRCDYDCTAVCLDSCPAPANGVAVAPVTAPAGGAGCGGPLGCFSLGDAANE